MYIICVLLGLVFIIKGGLSKKRDAYVLTVLLNMDCFEEARSMLEYICYNVVGRRSFSTPCLTRIL